ncbi:hypothetical protein GCM10011584_03720 [Nocardioides phosphati]|uniref:Cytochrome c biogenesis protein CcdA n=1 Tax=Nocardioides phosphati TaxID=1867775 RepID=A0ABQ2N6G8_9ACTN|nr:cytochrome c biogenesis protein CcdA [Nocardioides phosphati]GGO84946.1 hypothetical protein GCM10011584_03720 [Nocardioides phosphati]
MHGLLFSSMVLASFLGGVVALLAPCCVSVMLPAYFASSFRSRTHIVAMTLVFALGVGTVILPIGLGATALSRVISGNHTPVFTIMGALMTLGGLAVLGGWSFMLPMPAMRNPSGRRAGSVYLLGVFSGVASSCCAPVLAGVVALSGASAAFFPALVAGSAYVFGMVAPLALLALVWDLRDWGQSRVLAQRRLSMRLGSRRWSLPLASLASGLLMVAMGVLTVVIAFRGPSMPTDGWQVRLTAWLNHAASRIEAALGWLPPMVPALAIVAALAALVYFAAHRAAARTESRHPVAPTGAPAAALGADPRDESSAGPSCCDPQPKGTR